MQELFYLRNCVINMNYYNADFIVEMLQFTGVVKYVTKLRILQKKLFNEWLQQ